MITALAPASEEFILLTVAQSISRAASLRLMAEDILPVSVAEIMQVGVKLPYLAVKLRLRAVIWVPASVVEKDKG